MLFRCLQNWDLYAGWLYTCALILVRAEYYMGIPPVIDFQVIDSFSCSITPEQLVWSLWSIHCYAIFLRAGSLLQLSLVNEFQDCRNLSLKLMKWASLKIQFPQLTQPFSELHHRSLVILIEEVMESDSSLQDRMHEGACGLLGCVPYGLENVVALIVIPLVEKQNSFIEAAASFFLVFILCVEGTSGADSVRIWGDF